MILLGCLHLMVLFLLLLPISFEILEDACAPFSSPFTPSVISLLST